MQAVHYISANTGSTVLIWCQLACWIWS